MAEVARRVVEDGLNWGEINTFGTQFPNFIPLQGDPRDLGFAAHGRLESLLETPIASSDSNSRTSNPATGQTAGVGLGDYVGRRKEFTKNLPQIKDNITAIAQDRGIDEAIVWDEVVKILSGSGIGGAMRRTLTRPFEDEYDLSDYIEQNSGSGITLLARENIANWGARRHELLLSQLGSLSRVALGNIERIIYAGGGRVYSGAELWRPEIKPFVFEVDGEKRSDMSEYLAAEKIHAPRLRQVLGKNALTEDLEVHVVPVYGPNVSGDYVARTVAEAFPGIKDNLIIEFGNAPAGYTQLLGALTISEVFGKYFDPTTQYVATTDDVTIVHPDHFASLNLEERSRVQNGATALNSLNGWLGAIADVNRYLYERQQIN